jgi:signal transduction histidine kinase
VESQSYVLCLSSDPRQYFNAIDAMKGEDRVRDLAIKSQRREDAQVMVSVSDMGVGSPPQRADQIFNAFFTKPYGTGMGLRISRSIVEAHGADCGPIIIIRAAQLSISHCLPRHVNNACSAY